MALPNSGITTSLVGNAIGSTSRKVGVLCTSSGVNKWAKGKPVPHSTTSAITDAQRKAVNQGFNIANAFSLSIGDLFTKAKSTPDWVYTPPSGNTQPYRLGDFRLYNHSAVQPYNFSSFPTTVNSYNDTCEVSFRIVKNSGADLSLSDFAYFDNYGSMKYAIAYKHSSWSASDIRFMYGASISSTANEIVIEGTLPRTGTYEILPIVTMETGTTSDAFESIYLPNGYRTLTFNKLTAYATVTISNYSNITPTFDYGNNLYMFGNMINLSITNTTSGVSVPSTDNRLVFLITCFDSNDYELGAFTFTDPTSNDTFIYSGSGTQTYILDYNGGGHVYLSDYVSYADSIARLRIEADIQRISGSGVCTLAKHYEWECYRY